MEMYMAQSTVGLRLDGDIQKRLKSLGKLRDRSPHYLMKEAVEKYLASEEAIESEKKLMQSRWEQYELTGETVDHSNVKKWVSGLNVADKKQA
jgi:predicted transcriptional regulator